VSGESEGRAASVRRSQVYPKEETIIQSEENIIVIDSKLQQSACIQSPKSITLDIPPIKLCIFYLSSQCTWKLSLHPPLSRKQALCTVQSDGLEIRRLMPCDTSDNIRYLVGIRRVSPTYPLSVVSRWYPLALNILVPPGLPVVGVQFLPRDSLEKQLTFTRHICGLVIHKSRQIQMSAMRIPVQLSKFLRI